MILRKKIFYFIAFLSAGLAFVFLANNSLALDTGTNVVSSTIQLGSDSPLKIAARIINFVMIFLGVIAVSLMIYAGFRWMTSSGSEEQVDEAKKTLKMAVIGLVIILSSWGVTAFVLNRLITASGNGNNTGSGPVIPGGGCTGAGCAGSSCDGNSLLAGCQAGSCQAGLTCSPSSCTCVSDGNTGGNQGDSCSSSENTCNADNTKCNGDKGLKCNSETCTCEGRPVITEISPVGGFCDGDASVPCNEDGEQCEGLGGASPTCNTNTPNGKPGNIISIYGYNFGNDKSMVKVLFGDTDSEPAKFASEVYSNCASDLSDSEITVVIPDNAADGKITVAVANGGVDATSDDNGPQISDFKLSGIVRPGICAISPDSGLTGESVKYDGINFLNDTKGYFGNYSQNFKAVSSEFESDVYGKAVVPNIADSKIKTFVGYLADNKAIVYSNTKEFKKISVPTLKRGATISSFEPSTGNVGQYVTIYGSGFGDAKGTSQVFFGNTEADYNFPQACLQSVWKDNRIVVKVPSGMAKANYLIKVQVDSQGAAGTEYFAFDSALPLSPSICRLDPEMGPVDTSVKIWGEYFKNNTSVARFYNQKDSAATKGATDNGADTVSANVPNGAISGPVKVVRDNLVSNGLNFAVGECSGDESCNGNVCCPTGSPKKGQCANNLLGCYFSIKSSVFEWAFNTNVGTSCDGDASSAKCDLNNQLCPEGQTCNGESCSCEPCSGPNCGGVGSACSSDPNVCTADNTKCNSGLSCNPSSCTCQSSTAYSCAYKAKINNSCPTGFCPNSPGVCSPFAGSTSGKVMGSCDLTCNNFDACKGDKCILSTNAKYCLRNVGLCNLDKVNNLVNGYTAVCTALPEYGGASHYVIEEPGTCPTGWIKLKNGKCTDSISTNKTCTGCDDGFKCASTAITSGNTNPSPTFGRCMIDKPVCPSGSNCETTGANAGKCMGAEAADCACCCEKDKGATQCCAQTTCQGTCGDGSANLGYCGGCYSASNTVAQNDQACNCSNASGKFCLNNSQYPSGACVDCTQLSDSTSCTAHAASCCWDDKDSVCRGGDGKKITTDTGNAAYGHCAFYGCSGATCNSAIPAVYSITDSPYSDTNTCTTGCAQSGNTTDPGADTCATYNTLDAFTRKNSCIADSKCCYDSYTTLCKGGTRLAAGEVGASLVGFCAYFKCSSSTQTCVSSFNYGSATGPYNSLSACNAACKVTTATGKACAEGDICKPDSCGAPFSCMKDGSETCGTCCCDPAATNDACALTDPALSCEANRGACSGNGRGLCCGCKTDDQCGSPESTGCSITSCCEPRPQVLTDKTSPTPEQQNVCRNSIVNIPFNEQLDPLSVTGNVVLLAEKALNDNCPIGSMQVTQKLNIWQRILAFFDRTYNTVARLFNKSAVADMPDATKYKYCLVSGAAIAEESGSNTNVRFYPEKVLDPSTNYYVVVKGQENTASSSNGIISTKGIGLRDSGYNGYEGPWNDSGKVYTGSYIYRFKTMASNNASSGLCLVNKVEILPKSYLFNTATNDPAENDNDPLSATFDTKADKDKVYVANALAADGQLLQSLPGTYFWNFTWSLSAGRVVEHSPVLSPTGDRRQVGVVSGTTDGSVEINAQVNIDGIFGVSSKSSTEKVSVFICSNPWPAPTTLNGYLFWQPFIDKNTNCTTGNCANYNYSFYYCRDSGAAGTDDDLPSLSGKGEVIRGQSDKRVCSNDRAKDCLADADCESGGVCVYEMLKESYFFSN